MFKTIKVKIREFWLEGFKTNYSYFSEHYISFLTSWSKQPMLPRKGSVIAKIWKLFYRIIEFDVCLCWNIYFIFFYYSRKSLS